MPCVLADHVTAEALLANSYLILKVPTLDCPSTAPDDAAVVLSTESTCRGACHTPSQGLTAAGFVLSVHTPQGTASMSMGICSNVSSQDWSDAPFTSILTNGKGFMGAAANGTKKRAPVGSPYVVRVEKGKRYR